MLMRFQEQGRNRSALMGLPPEFTPEPQGSPTGMMRSTGSTGSPASLGPAASMGSWAGSLSAEELKAMVERPEDIFAAGPHEAFMLGSSKVQPRGTAFVEPDFQEKHCLISGAPNETVLRRQLAQSGVAITCRKGKKHGQPNQDNYFCVQTDAFMLCGVADGHGESGHWVSQWASRVCCRLLWAEVCEKGALPGNEALVDIFDAVHRAVTHCSEVERFDVSLSGTTLSVCVVDRRDRSAVFAWVGDSRCAAGKAGKGGSPMSRITPSGVGTVVSIDHKPQDPDERRRILSHGGEVVRIDGDVPQRVFARGQEVPGLAMSRAIGDLVAHAVGVIHQPGVRRFALEAGQPILCCSDGIWEFIKSGEAVKLVSLMGSGGVVEAAESLAKEAWERWLHSEDMSDDITVILMWP